MVMRSTQHVLLLFLAISTLVPDLFAHAHGDRRYQLSARRDRATRAFRDSRAAVLAGSLSRQASTTYSVQDGPSVDVFLSFSGGSSPSNKCRNCPNGGTWENVTWACNGGASQYQGDWNGGDLPFADPLPPPTASNVVVGVDVQMFGRFNCLSQADGDFMTIFIQSTKINGTRLPAEPKGCDCPQCLSSITASYEGIIDGYEYGGTNHLLVSLLEPPASNYVCISYLQITFYYAEARPILFDVLPPAGPMEGNTNVKLWGENWNPYIDLNCFWGENAEPTPAQYLAPYFASCNTTSTTQSGDVSLWLEVVATGEKFDTTTGFTYYANPNATKLDPESGPEAGGNTVYINGGPFVDLPQNSPLICLFGGQKLSAQRMSSSQIACPKIPRGTGEVQVQLSQNGQQFYGNLVYKYLDPRAQDSPSPLVPGWVLISGFFALCTLVAVAFVAFTKQCRRPAIGNKSNSEPFETDGLLSPGRPSNVFDITKQIDISDVTIRERIGKGTFGEVYKGTWRGTDVAVKFLTAGFGSDAMQDQEFLSEFDREVTIMRCCRHPNVLQFLGACAAPPNVCIVMEFMPRGSLFSILHDSKMQERINLKRLRHMLEDAAKGMNYLHNSNPVIIHRDLKSHNLLVDENYKVKVCDFGLSKILETQADVASLTACGTPSWTAPEILRNEQYSEAADVYSYGIVLWECVTRQDPYEGMPPFQVVLAVGTKGMRPPLNDGDYPAEWISLIRECWAEDPNLRPTFDEIIEKLGDFCGGGGSRDNRRMRRHAVSSSSEVESTTDRDFTTSSFSPPIQATPRILFRADE